MYKNPQKFRDDVSLGMYKNHTSGQVPGYAQGNIVIVPYAYAYDFVVFAYRNPKACPILGISDPGKKTIKSCSGDDNIYLSIPEYYVFKDGEIIEKSNQVESYYQDDFVIFVIGCSFTFESELINEGIELKHIKEGKNVAMFNTSIALSESGCFKGNMVVSMRPIAENMLDKVIEITGRFPSVHGSPVHIGQPEQIGIEDLSNPDYGEAIVIEEGEVPVFWACGVTPQNALRHAKLPIAITHAPGKMLITDIKNESLKV